MSCPVSLCFMSKTKERHAGYGLVSPKKCDIMCLTRSSLACKGELRKATTKSEDFGVGMCLTRSSLACKGELRKATTESMILEYNVIYKQ